MRILLLTRGAPGCGKSTWIEENGLKPYTLSPDDIRLLCQSPVLQTDGTKTISQKNETAVWSVIMELLKVRMSRGELTVLDATNSTTKELNRYLNLSEDYRYRIYCVDFTDIPIGETKRRNAGREQIKRVPEEVIDMMYARFPTQKVPLGIRVIKPEELESVWLKLADISEYKKVHHIGDIHGCYTVLQKYLEENDGIKDDECYIFVGDYIDRGTENIEIIRFLLSVMEQKNVILLEGNHEKWLHTYSRDEVGNSEEFEQVTRPQLEQSGIDKKDIRRLCQKLKECAYYRYEDKVFLVTHGGLCTLPENLSFVAAEQMIKGVGRYEEDALVAETFLHTTPENCYQIYGHRNTKRAPIQVNERVFNLEGQVECGGHLRCVQVSHDGIRMVETKK